MGKGSRQRTYGKVLNDGYCAIKRKKEKMSKKQTLKIKKLHDAAIIPQYQRDGDAGFDLHAVSPFAMQSRCTAMVRLGLAFEVPNGYELQIRSRSGLAAKNGVFILNGVGTVDCGYRGEVCAILHNASNTAYFGKAGDRVCQGVLKKVDQADIVEVAELTDTERGTGGFGSTGK